MQKRADVAAGFCFSSALSHLINMNHMFALQIITTDINYVLLRVAPPQDGCQGLEIELLMSSDVFPNSSNSLQSELGAKSSHCN